MSLKDSLTLPPSTDTEPFNDKDPKWQVCRCFHIRTAAIGVMALQVFQSVTLFGIGVYCCVQTRGDNPSVIVMTVLSILLAGIVVPGIFGTIRQHSTLLLAIYLGLSGLIPAFATTFGILLTALTATMEIDFEYVCEMKSETVDYLVTMDHPCVAYRKMTLYACGFVGLLATFPGIWMLLTALHLFMYARAKRQYLLLATVDAEGKKQYPVQSFAGGPAEPLAPSESMKGESDVVDSDTRSFTKEPPPPGFKVADEKMKSSEIDSEIKSEMETPKKKRHGKIREDPKRKKTKISESKHKGSEPDFEDFMAPGWKSEVSSRNESSKSLTEREKPRKGKTDRGRRKNPKKSPKKKKEVKKSEPKKAPVADADLLKGAFAM